MTPQHHLPADIERTSLSIITKELDEMGLTPPPETAAVHPRCGGGRSPGSARGRDHCHRHQHGAGRYLEARACKAGV